MSYKCPECGNSTGFACTVWASALVDADGILTETFMAKEYNVDDNLAMTCYDCEFVAETTQAFEVEDV